MQEGGGVAVGPGLVEGEWKRREIEGLWSRRDGRERESGVCTIYFMCTIFVTHYYSTTTNNNNITSTTTIINSSTSITFITHNNNNIYNIPSGLGPLIVVVVDNKWLRQMRNC